MPSNSWRRVSRESWAHTYESIEDETIRGLLEDQEAAYDMMFEDVASGRALSVASLISATNLAEDALAGKLNRANGNGGRTVDDIYHPPEAE